MGVAACPAALTTFTTRPSRSCVRRLPDIFVEVAGRQSASSGSDDAVGQRCRRALVSARALDSSRAPRGRPGNPEDMYLRGGKPRVSSRPQRGRQMLDGIARRKGSVTHQSRSSPVRERRRTIDNAMTMREKTTEERRARSAQRSKFRRASSNSCENEAILPRAARLRRKARSASAIGARARACACRARKGGESRVDVRTKPTGFG